MQAIYASSSVSLAALEILVHFAVLPRGFVLSEIRIPSRVPVEALPASKLPPGWDDPEPSPAAQALGGAWLAAQSAAVLTVPSAIVPTEHNLLLNPRHPAFRHIRFLPPQPFRFDPRLK